MFPVVHRRRKLLVRRWGMCYTSTRRRSSERLVIVRTGWRERGGSCLYGVPCVRFPSRHTSRLRRTAAGDAAILVGDIPGAKRKKRDGADGHTDSAQEVRDMPLVERRAQAYLRGCGPEVRPHRGAYPRQDLPRLGRPQVRRGHDLLPLEQVGETVMKDRRC